MFSAVQQKPGGVKISEAAREIQFLPEGHKPGIASFVSFLNKIPLALLRGAALAAGTLLRLPAMSGFLFGCLCEMLSALRWGSLHFFTQPRDGCARKSANNI